MHQIRLIAQAHVDRAAARRELDGVADQVVEHLLEVIAVGLDRAPAARRRRRPGCDGRRSTSACGPPLPSAAALRSTGAQWNSSLPDSMRDTSSSSSTSRPRRAVCELSSSSRSTCPRCSSAQSSSSGRPTSRRRFMRRSSTCARPEIDVSGVFSSCDAMDRNRDFSLSSSSSSSTCACRRAVAWSTRAAGRGSGPGWSRSPVRGRRADP